MLDIVVCFLLAVIFFIILIFFSFGFKGTNYFSVDIFLSEINQKFLIVPYIISPAVYIFVIIYILNIIGFRFNTNYLWITSVVIIFIRILAIVVASRLKRIQLLRWFLVSILAILVAFVTNHVILQELNGNNVNRPLTLIMSVISIVSIGSLFHNARFGDLDKIASYEKAIRHSFKMLQTKYGNTIGSQFDKGGIKYLIFFSIMIAEDLNRPRAVRMVENIVAKFRPISTTGIMQVSSESILSDEKSVELAKELIGGSFDRHSKNIQDTYELVRAVAGDYNGDAYPDLVVDIFYIIRA